MSATTETLGQSDLAHDVSRRFRALATVYATGMAEGLTPEVQELWIEQLSRLIPPGLSEEVKVYITILAGSASAFAAAVAARNCPDDPLEPLQAVSLIMERAGSAW